MYEDNIPVEVHLLQIGLRYIHESGEVTVGYHLRSAVEGIVKPLGYLEKGVISFDDVPTRVDAQLVQQRYHPVQYLRYPAPAESGVDVLDFLAGQLASQQPQLFNGAAAHYRLVVSDVYLMRFSIFCISNDLSPSSV